MSANPAEVAAPVTLEFGVGHAILLAVLAVIAAAAVYRHLPKPGEADKEEFDA